MHQKHPPAKVAFSSCLPAFLAKGRASRTSREELSFFDKPIMVAFSLKIMGGFFF
jgi:hypothetical protein